MLEKHVWLGCNGMVEKVCLESFLSVGVDFYFIFCFSSSLYMFAYTCVPFSF